MVKDKLGFCTKCGALVQCSIRKAVRKYNIREKEYDMEVTTAFCKICGNEVEIPEIEKLREKEVDEQYRKQEQIISVDYIQKLMGIYNIGKAPLSLALGFGEITITRYLQGQIPSREYSDVMGDALKYPKRMIEYLKKHEEKIGETAYKKALKAAEELDSLMCVSEKMLATISYVFERMHEVAPLALQQLLYFIQGFYMAQFGKPLYEEDCIAGIHGPVYEPVYEMFKTFTYNPMEDERFAMLKNRFQELDAEEKEVIDMVLCSFGMYSGKVLEQIACQEEPWIQAQEGCLPLDHSRVIIEKNAIYQYFVRVSEKYDVASVKGIREYIYERLACD